MSSLIIPINPIKAMNSLLAPIPMNKKLISRSLLGSLALAGLMLVNGSANAADAYFDVNGTTAGSGVVGAGSYGDWTTATEWSTSSVGTAVTTAWTSDDDAIFAAGTDSAGLTYTINLAAGTTTANSITKNQAGSLAVGAGALSLTSGIIDITDGGGFVEMAAAISGANGLTKNGAGFLNLTSGAATYTGDTTINGGILRAFLGNKLPSASRLVLNNDGAFESFAGNSTVAGISGISTSSFVQNWFDGGAATITTSKSSGAESYAGTIRNGGAADLNIVKDGAFTQSFSGNNIYTGSTTVTAGTLLINGDSSAATGAVTVEAAGTLGGTGTIGGATTLAAGGSLSAGDSSRDTLTFSNGLDISAVNDTGSLLFSLGTAVDSDMIASGALTIGTGVVGFSDFAFTDETGFGNGVYTLFSSSGITGSLDVANLTGTVGGLDSTLSISGNDILLTVVPEPSTAGLILLGLALSAAAKRKRS